MVNQVFLSIASFCGYAFAEEAASRVQSPRFKSWQPVVRRLGFGLQGLPWAWLPGYLSQGSSSVERMHVGLTPGG
jgi:hypothetical protein